MGARSVGGRMIAEAFRMTVEDHPDRVAVRTKEDEVSLEELAGEETVRAAVQTAVDRANEQLARVEQVKRCTVLRGDWVPGGDELTPTMKLKRRPIAEKYADEIEAMYAARP